MGGQELNMVTKQQIDQFTKSARARGFSELQISQEIARKNQEDTKSSLSQQNTQQNQPLQSQPLQSQPLQSSQPQQNQNFARKAVDATANFLIPRLNTLQKTVRGSLNLKDETTALEKSNAQLYKKSLDLIKLARKETDPTKKSQYLKQSKDLNELASGNTDSLLGKADELQATSGIKDGDTNLGYATRQGIGVAGEVGSWLLPAGKLVKGAKLLQGAGLVKKILRSTVTGAAIGGLYAATSPEDLTAKERAGRTVGGAAVAGATSGVLTGVTSGTSNLIKKFVKNNSSRINKLFKISPSDRANFRKTTGGMDFAEEILKRDAQEMKGLDHAGLYKHFGKRVKTAVKEKAKMLKGSKGEVKTKVIMDQIKETLSSLKPGKGNVGQAGVIKALKKQLSDLKKNPKTLTPELANKIKTQIQEAGRTAYSATGKATPTSKAMASLGTFVKELVEDQVEGVKDVNRTIQLYQLAKKSIGKTGDREASKISNDIVQKFLQVIPAGVGVGAGLGGYAIGGPGGGAAGLALGMLVSGGAGASRVKYLSPEAQTKLIAQMSKIAGSQGIKNSAKWASKINGYINEVVTRKVSQSLADRPSQSTQDQQTQSTQPPGIFQEIQKETQPVESSFKTDVSEVDTQEQAQPQTVTIRNKQTGEIKTVSSGELGQYGLGEQAQNGSGVPNKEDILIAMLADMEQTGGKNLSKLNTILSAYESIYPEDEEEGKADKESGTARTQRLLGESGLRALDEVEELFEEDPNSVLKSSIPGQLGSRSYSAASYRAVEALLRARSGAAIPPEEIRSYVKANLPRLGDKEEDIQSKLSAFRKDLEALAGQETF